MKKMFKILCLAVVLTVSFQLTSCGSAGNSPIDQYVALIEEATEKIEKVTSLEQLKDIQTGDQSIKEQALLEQSRDYELTDSDKEKLKKATDKMLHAMFDKSLELSQLPDDIKESMKSQAELAVEAVNTSIDQAKTLGEINGLR